ncbi:MAG: hypothetical protein ACKVOK_16880, partial [Flavobacteriales bacterium]
MSASKSATIVSWLLLIPAVLWGQAKTLIYPEYPGNTAHNERISTQAALHSSLQTTYLNLLSAGYIDCQIDTFAHDSVIEVRIDIGKKYGLNAIEIITDSLGKNKEISNYKSPLVFGENALRLEAEKWLVENEKKGFPFVSMQLEELSFDSVQNARVVLRLDRGPQILFDSLIILSSVKMPRRYVQGYINLRKGEYYNEEKMQGIQSKLRELPFLQITRPSEIQFNQNKFNLRLYLAKKKANYFNGILGIRPDESTGKVNITGDLEVKLLNALNTGEEFYFNWRKLQPQTQDLTMNLSLPYLFSTPLGLDGDLKIYRRDSTFSSVKSALGLVLHFGGNDKLKLFIEKNNTSQLATFVTAQTVGNVNSTLYGLSLQKENLDYKWNPRKGYKIKIELATGMRNPGSNTNSEIPTVVINKRNVYRGEIAAEYFIPTWKRQTIRLGAMGGALEAESIYDNEMFRIGGLRTLRGFNEESVFVTSWAVTSLEYRFLLETNSAIYAFVDQAWYEKQGINNFITDTPLGFGAGINFETGAGIFTFNYAMGTQFDNPILVKNAKISFGFRNVF